jgi:ABC-type multidrug transport system fused ATPase/permease subunit
MELIGILTWILGRKNIRIFKHAFISQILLSGLDIIFLALILNVLMSFSSSLNEQYNVSHLLPLDLTPTQALIGISLALGIKSILNLGVRAWVLNSLGEREAEVNLAFIQNSLLEDLDATQNTGTTDVLQLYTAIIGGVFLNTLKPLTALVGEFTTIVAVVAFLFLKEPEVSLLLTAYFLVATLVIGRILGIAQTEIGKKSLNLNRESLRDFSEIIFLKLELKLANREDESLGELLKNRYSFAKISVKFNIIQTLPRYILEFLLVSGLGAVIILVNTPDRSNSNISQLGLLIAAGFRVLPAVNSIVINFGAYKNSIPSLYRLRDLGQRFGMYGLPIEFRKRTRPSPTVEYSGDICFRNVTYKYPNSEKNLFTNFTFTIPANSVTLIRGRNGSGKTTLIKLMLGLIQPNSGSVVFLGSEAEIFATSVNAGIRYVSQEVHLSDKSFGYNIAMRSTTEEDKQRLIDVAKLVGLHERIENSDSGFDTLIGQNGKTLSSGERQRLGIARALFDSPSMIILDEPTANLDLQSATQVWKILENIKDYVTIVIVSHLSVPQTLYDNVLDLP